MAYNQYWEKLVEVDHNRGEQGTLLHSVRQEKLDTGGFVHTSEAICAHKEEGVYDEIHMTASTNAPGHL